VIPLATGTPQPQAPDARSSASLPEGGGGEAGGLRCRVCGLDEVPWPRTAYCSERCRRRAAYLARRHRPLGTAGRPVGGPKPRGTTR
jgi:hypothetical protein